MPTRYIVHGTDTATGKRVRKLFEADSAGAAEETARRIGVEVLGVEVAPEAVDVAPPPPRAAGSAAAHSSGPDTGLPPTDVSGEWHGSPSQWQNFWWFLACVLVAPIPIAIWRYLVVRTTTYTLTSQRLQKRWGIFPRRLEEVELYRVKDTNCTRTLLERLLGVGTLTLHTSDKTADVMSIRWIPSPEGLRELIREHVEAVRRSRGVREMDFTEFDVA